MSLSGAKTYIYIDVSNIRHACFLSCEFNIDFIKLYHYLQNKYPNTQEIRYYEGVSLKDKKKLRHFEFLSKQVGYKVCSLKRKSYAEPAKYENFDCENCGFSNKVKILSEKMKLKSNVDVYLTSDMLECAAKAKEPINIIILSCDGDYAEAIKTAIRLSPASHVTILATPMTKINNCLSSRLQAFANRNIPNVDLVNIATIKDKISQPLQNKTS